MDHTPAPAPITMSVQQAAAEVGRIAESRGDSTLARHAGMVAASTAAPESWKEEIRRFAREWNIGEIGEPPPPHPIDRVLTDLAAVKARMKARAELPDAKDDLAEKLLSLSNFVDDWIRERGGKNGARG